MKLPNENAEKDAEKDKAEKQPNDKDSPSDDDKRSEGMCLWQYGLWIFQAGGTKLERFIPKKGNY